MITTDTERLDWCARYLLSVEANLIEYKIEFLKTGSIKTSIGKDFRQAIDNAMKGKTK